MITKVNFGKRISDLHNFSESIKVSKYQAK